MGKYILTQSRSNRIAAGVDIVASLLIEQIGLTYKLPFYHPFILAPVIGMTYAFFKWKREISELLLDGISSLDYNIKNSQKVISYIPPVFNTATGSFKRGMETVDSVKEDLRRKMITAKSTRNKNWYKFCN